VRRRRGSRRRLVRPGVLVADVANASFEPYLRRGYLTSTDSRTMPYNWQSNDDGSPRLVPRRYVPDVDWESQGRKLTHVYPALAGPHNPNVGHSVSMAKFKPYNIASNNHDRLEEGMTFVCTRNGWSHSRQEATSAIVTLGCPSSRQGTHTHGLVPD